MTVAVAAPVVDGAATVRERLEVPGEPTLQELDLTGVVLDVGLLVLDAPVGDGGGVLVLGGRLSRAKLARGRTARSPIH